MEFFQRAKVFMLKCSHHSKYLTADENEESIKQSRDSSSNRARWAYELVEGKSNVIRLRSTWSYRYLGASEDPFLLGMTGKKVSQTIIRGPALEWEPIKEGPYIKLKSHTGSFLRANTGLPPWRNSVTHDEPRNWTAKDNMILWIVDIVEIDYESTGVAAGGSTMSKQEDKGNSDSSLPSDVNQKSKLSDSFDELKTTLSSLEDEHDYKEEESSSAEPTSEEIHQREVEMAKQTLKEIRDLDFHTILSSERDQKLTEALKVLIADSKISSQDDIPSDDLINLEDELLVLKNKHDLASQDLVECTNFSTQKSKITAELKKDAAKARELETIQAELKTARAKRDELLKQIGELDIVIKDVEISQADNSVQVEEVISRMGQKSQKLEEMKQQEVHWQVRRTDANRMLEKVEEDWVKIITIFSDDS